MQHIEHSRAADKISDEARNSCFFLNKSTCEFVRDGIVHSWIHLIQRLDIFNYQSSCFRFQVSICFKIICIFEEQKDIEYPGSAKR